MIVINVPIWLAGPDGQEVQGEASFSPVMLAHQGIIVDHPTDPKRCFVHLQGVRLEVRASRKTVLASVEALIERAQNQAALTAGLGGARGRS